MEQLSNIVDSLVYDIELTRFTEAGEEIESNGITGLRSGFPEIDKLTCGFQLGEMIVLSGLPNMGKTNFLLSMINQRQNNIIYFSTRLSSNQLTKKLICNYAEISLFELQNGSISNDLIGRITLKYKKKEIYFVDTPEITCELINQILEENITESNYLVLINDLNFLEYHIQTSIEDKLIKLKGIARKYNLPIIGVYNCKLTENTKNIIESNGTFHNLNSSFVDMNCTIFRPEYFKITEDEHGNSVLGLAQFIITKSNCKNGKVNLKYIPGFFKFSESNVSLNQCE